MCLGIDFCVYTNRVQWEFWIWTSAFFIKFGKMFIQILCLSSFFLLFWDWNYSYVDMLSFVLEVSEALSIFYLIFFYVLQIGSFLLIYYGRSAFFLFIYTLSLYDYMGVLRHNLWYSFIYFKVYENVSLFLKFSFSLMYIWDLYINELMLMNITHFLYLLMAISILKVSCWHMYP